MSDLHRFVTAKLKGRDDARQGVVISTDPLVILGQSGSEYECEGKPAAVDNPPRDCIGCGLPLGRLCVRCEANIEALERAIYEAGLQFTDITTRGAPNE